MRVAERIDFDNAFDRRQRDPLRRLRAVAGRGKREGALFDLGLELRGLGDRVDETPGDGLLAAHAFAGGAEDVREVVANVALVGQPCETAGSGQHAEEGHFRQADGARAVIDQDDLVTR